MATSSEILRVDQCVALASLARKLIATKSEDVAKINDLTAQIAEKDSNISDLLARDSEVSEKASSLSNEIQALIVEASAALPQPV